MGMWRRSKMKRKTPERILKGSARMENNGLAKEYTTELPSEFYREVRI